MDTEGGDVACFNSWFGVGFYFVTCPWWRRFASGDLAYWWFAEGKLWSEVNRQGNDSERVEIVAKGQI